MNILSGLVKSRKLYSGDFETTTDPNDCRVWLWATADIETDDVVIGNNIQSFCRFLADQEAYVWFHNLAFDGSFIIDHLLRSGYEWVKENPLPRQFSTTISAMGKFYSIIIHWKRNCKTEMRDSLKKLPMSVGIISKAFNLEEVKGKIDYDAYRPVGYEPNENEIEYITNDVLIVSRAIRSQLNSGLTGLTVGADALNEYKDIVGKENFTRLFPVLPMDVDKEIRKAYRGGFTFANPRYSKQILGKGKVYDVNSLYPAVMYDRLLPYGEPVWLDERPQWKFDYPLWIASITITAKLKPNMIPCIQIKGSNIFSSTEYQVNIDEPTTLGCTNVDWELWNEHYDIEVHEYGGTFYFQALHGLFTDYIDKWSTIKANSTGGMRTIAKLQLNSLYGKFATNPNVTPKIPILEDDKVRLIMGDLEERNPVYTAMGVFITSYARTYTIQNAQKHYDRFAYADTDSLHLLGWDDVDLEVHPSKMGAWKHEYDFTQAYFLRAKAYTERIRLTDYGESYENNGWLETHIAGLPKKAADQVKFEHYENGHKFGGKLSPMRVPGGIVLVDIDFTLKKEK